MFHAFDILAKPTYVFERLKQNPTWKGPFLMVAIGLSSMAWLKSCWREGSFSLSITAFVVSSVVVPLLVFIIWLGLSAFVFLASRLIVPEKETRYRTVFSIVSHCGTIYLLEETVNFLLVRYSTLGNIPLPVAGRFPYGFDILALGSDVRLPLAILLHSINLFSVWYLGTMSLGLSIAAELDLTKARIVSVVVWLTGVGVAMVFVLIAGGTRIGLTF